MSREKDAVVFVVARAVEQHGDPVNLTKERFLQLWEGGAISREILEQLQERLQEYAGDSLEQRRITQQFITDNNLGDE